MTYPTAAAATIASAPTSNSESSRLFMTAIVDPSGRASTSAY